MEEPEKRKQLAPQKRNALKESWDGIKFRHKDVDVRAEWDKYVNWLKTKKISEPQPSIKSLIDFEKKWLKSINVARIRNPSSFTKKEKEISLIDIQTVSGLLLKRRIETTEDEVRALLIEGVTVLSVDLWLSNNIMPKNIAFKKFIASKGWR